MTDWAEVLVVDQPELWAVTHQGMGILNRSEGVATERLEQPCTKCDGVGTSVHMMRMLCDRCDATGREPYWVMLTGSQDWCTRAEQRSLELVGGEFAGLEAFEETGYVLHHGAEVVTTIWMHSVTAVAQVVSCHREASAIADTCWLPPEYQQCSEWAQYDDEDSPAYEPMFHWGLSHIYTLKTPVEAANPGGRKSWQPDQQLIEKVTHAIGRPRP